jgi:hypothetical protein
MSIAGGLPRAVDRAQASRCDALQIFTKSVGQWRARPLPADEVIAFRERLRETGIRPVVAHNRSTWPPPPRRCALSQLPRWARRSIVPRYSASMAS